MVKGRRTKSAEAVATHLCWDIDEVCEAIYQPGLFPIPIFSIGDGFMCSARKGRKPPEIDRDGMDREFGWQAIGEWRGWIIYTSADPSP